MFIGNFDKQPARFKTYSLKLVKRLPSGTTISSASTTAIKISDDSDVSAAVVVGNVVSGTNVNVQVKGGSDGVDYKITTVVTLSDNDTPEYDVTMKVRAN